MPPRALGFQPSPSAADKFGLSGPDCVAPFVFYGGSVSPRINCFRIQEVIDRLAHRVRCCVRPDASKASQNNEHPLGPIPCGRKKGAPAHHVRRRRDNDGTVLKSYVVPASRSVAVPPVLKRHGLFSFWQGPCRERSPKNQPGKQRDGAVELRCCKGRISWVSPLKSCLQVNFDVGWGAQAQVVARDTFERACGCVVGIGERWDVPCPTRRTRRPTTATHGDQRPISK
jgi:hypothetical protein